MTRRGSILLFFVHALVWNLALGLSHIVVPLYANHLGFSAVQIGTLFSLPVIAQLVLGLVGGLATDRWSGRTTLMASSLGMFVAGVIFFLSESYPVMMLAQFCLTAGRSLFWPAVQAMASELPGTRSVQMGRLNAVMSVGQISGTASAGLLLVLLGYQVLFAGFGVLCLVCLVLAVRMESGRSGHAVDGAGLLRNFLVLLRNRKVYFALLCSFLCAQPISLIQSFLPLLLVSIGFGTEAVGPLVALRPVGATLATLLLARLIGSRFGLATGVAGGLMLALAVGLSPVLRDPVSAVVNMTSMGLGTGVLLLYYQLTLADVTDVASRGSALAIGGSGWGLSHLVVPFCMGFLVDKLGMASAFQVWGVVIVFLTFLLIPAYRWAGLHGDPSDR